MVRETRYLWIGNLPHTIREERILEHFKRYGKVQSVKILPKKQQEEENSACATVAFIDIKSAAKAHNADNKIDERTLKTDYYEPPASSTASSAIYIHERDDALVRPAPAPYTAGRTPRYGISEERNYDRPGHYYADREPYIRRPLGIGYHDEDSYQGRAKSRDRYSRSTPGNNYTEGTERNQNHFRPHNARQHFDQQRYPVADQYTNEREPATIPPPRSINRRTTNSSSPATPTIASVASSPTVKTESRPRRTKRRSPSRTPSGSRSNSGSRSRSSSGSRSSSSSSKLHSTSSDSSGRSRSPSKSRSPVSASYGSQSTNSKGVGRPSSAISTPSSITVCFLPATPNSTPSQQNCCTATLEENHCQERGDEKRPLGICVRNLPVRSTDTSLKDGLFHEYKKHGKVTMVKVIGQGTDRYAVVCFKKPEDVDKALEVSKDKLFFGCKIEVTAHEGLDAEDNEFRPLEAELDEFHPKATRTLFIGNLEKDITTPELRKHFDQFGEIIEIDIKKQGSATSYAFIQYSDIGSVVKAMRKLDGENLGANRIKLGFGKSMPTNCVWLDGIVDSVSDKFLARHFSRFGIVAYTAVDREKGHALVFYENVEFAQIAVSEMRGRILQGKKLQVDFASRECQTTFFDKLEMTGQMVPGDGTRPWERRDRRGPEFEVVRTDDRETRVGFEARTYPRYEGQLRPPRGNFRGGQRAGFPARGRGQGFPARYNPREENNPIDVTMFDSKAERPKYVEPSSECPNRKRNKLRNSISDQESHHSQSPPRSCHQSRSTSPVSSKDRKATSTTPKDRTHHRIKSPGSHNSSLVNSPCCDEEMDTDYSRLPNKMDNDLATVERPCDGSPRLLEDSKVETESLRSRSSMDGESARSRSSVDVESLRSRSSVDVESADECDQLGQMERKKRLLASSNLKGGKELNLLVAKTLVDRMKASKVLPNNQKPLQKANCVQEGEEGNADVQTTQDSKPPENVKDLKYLQKKQVHLLHLLEQLGENANSNEGLVDGDRLALKKSREAAALLFESEALKALAKDECGIELCNSGIKDPLIIAKLKSKIKSMDGNDCISLSLDSFILQKHLDPRKGSDQHSVSPGNMLQNCRRISVDNEACLPSAQAAIDSLFCAPSPTTADVLWKKECNSFSDNNFPDTDCSLSGSHVKIENVSDDDVVSKKSLNSSFPLDFPSRLLSLRTVSDIRHEIKRERDISPLSLPLPKFAASLRSPKSSPSVLTSPKSTTAHSPRAGLSPSSYASSKNIRISDLFQDFQVEKKAKEPVPEERLNGVGMSPVESISPFESQTGNEAIELMANFESIQSPKSNSDKIKEHHTSSESESSPSASPNRPSIEDRIKALDEKFNVWSGSTRTAAAPDILPVVVPEVPRCPVKRSRFNFLAPEIRSEPSDIVKSLLARSTIFDQDTKRLQHIDEKYEPSNVKVDADPPKAKPTFRTKAAAKEFSTPIAPPPVVVQTLNQSSLVKAPALVAQGVASPPATPQSAPAASILSPITPPLQPFNAQVTPQACTPCSPRATPFALTNYAAKTVDTVASLDKDSNDHMVVKTPAVFKPKQEPNFHINSSALATTLKSPLHCSVVDIPAHPIMVSTSPPGIKKEPASPTDSVTEIVCKFEIDCKVPMKKETPSHSVTNIPLRKDIPVTLTKDHVQFNSIDHTKKEFCDSKDPRLAFHEGSSHWRENGCKDGIKVSLDSCAKSFVNNPGPDPVSAVCPASKKRVSSIDSTESESSKSVKSLDSSRDSQEISWVKQEKTSEPEPKKPKLSKSFAHERSASPPPPAATAQPPPRKSEKKEKSVKTEKSKMSTSKPSSTSIPEKAKTDSKNVVKSESKERPKSEHRNKEEKRPKARDSRDSTSNKEQRTKSRERKNSEKDKNSTSNNPINKIKKEQHVSKSDNKHENKRESDNKHESKKESKHESRSENKHESKTDKHESKTDKHESKTDKHESKTDKHDSKTDKHESKSDIKHENKSDNKHESKSGNKHESKSENKHDSKNEARHESKSESRHESRHESKSDSKHNKTENRHENKSDSKHDNKNENRHESKNESRHESKSESRHESKNERHENKNESRHESKNESRHESRSESESRHESKSENKSESMQESKRKSRIENKYECKNESESDCKSEDAKSDKKGEKRSTKKSSVSSLPFDWAKWMEDEPVYFSMYDKVKARSSKSQVQKTKTNDLDSVRQKFSKLKQSRAKREDKTKSIDQDSDKDSDTGSHHSSESDSQTKSSKSKQPRKRKLVIESSSDDDHAPHDSSSRISKIEKDFSDSATDSDFEYNVSRRQTSNMKVRKKKTELLDTDSSDSDSNFPPKSQTNTSKNPTQSRVKPRPEKTKKIVKSDYEVSDVEVHHKSKEKDNKLKKLKKEKTVEMKTEHESMDYEIQKKNDDAKSYKKKISKDSRMEPEVSSSQKKLKPDHPSKEKLVSPKERKPESSIEKMQIDDMEKHKPYSKKRKKSKKMSKNKERRSMSDKPYQDSKKHDDSDAKSSLPVLSPKPSNPVPDKQLSPPCLQAGVFSDNDFSDLDFDVHQNDIDMNSDLWKQDSNSDKSSKSKKKEGSAKSQNLFPEQDSSMPSFFDKLSDITDSEPGKEPTDCMSDVPSDGQKLEFPTSRKEKESAHPSPHKSKHEKHHDHSTKQESNKYSDTHSSSSKEERRKKKSKKQSKERKKKSREEKEASETKDESQKSSEVHLSKIAPKAESPKALFGTLAADDDSMFSELHLDVEAPEESRHFEEDFMVVTQDLNAFGDDGPSKREEKLLERRFEEEAAKETRRLEAELFSTGRDSWHMEEKDYDLEPSSDALCEDKHSSEIDSIITTKENIFAGLDLHSSATEPPQNETDVFLSRHSESDSYKIDDKEINEEIEDQRKIEDDLAVTALLQEMNCGEISAPELTKETDYLDPLIETHPEDTMNYLLPDDGENSLHIADTSSPEAQGNESQDEKVESPLMLLSPASNLEPPALEISTVEEHAVLLKIEESVPTVNENLKVESAIETEVIKEIKPISCYDFHDEDSMELAESKPPVIDIPIIEPLEQTKVFTSPKGDRSKVPKGKGKEKSPTKLDTNEETDNELNSELTKGQLTHFEDITMDITTDSKDDDNPPILIPVEAPRTSVTVPESKLKEEISRAPIEEIHPQNNTPTKTIPEQVETTESIFDKLVSDIDKQFGEILNHIADHPKPESKPYMISDSHSRCTMPFNMSDLADTNSNDSSIMNNSGLFDPPEAIKPLIRPYSEHLEQHNISTKYDEEINQEKYNLSQPSIPINHLPVSHANSLHPSCEIAVNQSQPVPKVEVATPSGDLSCLQNSEQFATSSNISAVTETNHGSSDSFLLDLFGPKSVEPEACENYSTDKLKGEESLVSNSDSKHKNEDSDISSTDNNHSSHATTSFEISEVNEQNEATEFNQEIFERTSDSVKDSKVPQLLSFSSDQLFNDMKNKSAEVNDNLSLHTNTSVIKSSETSPKVDDSVQLEKNSNFHPEDLDSNDRFDLQAKDEKDYMNSSEEHFSIEDSLAIKARSVDAESVCSDTTDITIPETKGETEVNQLPLHEEHEPMQEEVEPVVLDELVKPKADRPRRGRKPKTRKHAETSQERKQPQKPDAAPEAVNVIHTRSSSRRSRPTSTEAPDRVRRSLRSDNSEPTILREFRKKRYSVDEAVQAEVENVKKDVPEEDVLVSDGGTTDKSPTKHEEPKRKRGRRKKVSGNSQTSEKPEVKVEDTELGKDFHRPKESRLLYSLSSAEKEQKVAKDNASNNVDVYDFCEEFEDVDYTFVSVKEKLHDISRNNPPCNDLKHEKVVEPKHEKTDDQKHDRVSEQKQDRSIDQKHDKTADQKQEADQKPEGIVEQKHSRTADQKHGRTTDQKRSKSSDPDHGTEVGPEKEKKTGDPAVVEDHEPLPKEQLTEVKEQKRISIIIRVSPGSAEVVKRSEGLNEETKLDLPKSEKTSTKHETPSEVPYNGPCKSTRKSTRIMAQRDSTIESMKSVDEVIEDVIKAHSDADALPERRMTRRSRSNRRSEESLSREMAASENSNDTTDDKNVNEPVHFIRDNAVKDISEDKKKISSQITEVSQSSDTSTTESDKTSERGSVGSSLRGYRIRQTQAANKSESCKDASMVSNLTASDNESQRKDSSLSNSSEDKPSVSPHREHRKVKEVPKEFKITSDDTQANSSVLPVLKLEINRVKVDAPKECLPEKLSENEDSNSRASPARIDPVTGILPSSTETSSSYSESANTPFDESKISKNLVSDRSVYPSVLNIKNISSKTAPPASEAVAVISVIQESSSKNTQNVPETPPLAQNLRTRQQQQQPASIHPPPIAVPPTYIIDKHPLAENDIEPLKRVIKKNSVTTSVLTSVIATSTITAVTSQEPHGATNLAYAHASQGQYPVITGSGTPVLSSPTAISSHERNIGVQPKAQPAHIYEPHIRTSGVVTPTTVGHITSPMVPNVQKCSPAVTCVLTNKSELPSTNILPTPVPEHVFSASCKPVSLTTSTPPDHPNIAIKQEVLHPVPTSSPAAHSIPVATTWSGSKITSGSITDSHAHMNAAYPLKVAKVAHNINSAFSQQPMSYEDMISPHLVNSPSGGVIAELLQNPQQRHKEYLAGQERNRMPSDLATRGNPTPPDTPTPPSDMHGHSRQSSRIGIPLNPEYNAYVHHQMMFAHNIPYTAIHPELVAASVLGGYFPGSFKQPPPNHRLPMDPQPPDPKAISDLSQFVHESSSGGDQKSRSKSRSKTEFSQKDRKGMLKLEDERHMQQHEKVPSTSAIAPHTLRQHYPILQMSDRFTDSPGLYVAGQGRGQQIPPIPGDDHKGELGVHPSHLFKEKGDIQPPVAHQSTNPYARPPHAPMDGRSSTPAHSPMYKKDPLPHHGYPNDKRGLQDPHPSSTKAHHSRSLGSSISPGLQAHSPVPWAPVIQLSQSPHSSLSPHPSMLEQGGRRGVNAHHGGFQPEVPHHAPPPAHAMAPQSNVPRTPPIASQVPVPPEQVLNQNYPVIWQGLLALKNDQAAVQMHFVSGNPHIAKLSLPPLSETGEALPLRIAQRMRMETIQIDGVRKKLQMRDEHCILMALPCGKDPMDVRQQTINLREGFIAYLGRKKAAGIVNAALPGSHQPTYVIHIFPSCDFTDENLSRIAPDMLQIICGITHLVIIIATV